MDDSNFEPARPGLLRAPATKLKKSEWTALTESLEPRLLRLQFEHRESDFPLIVVLSGEDRPGAGELLARLGAWLDPRHIAVHALGTATDEEREQPPLWRFWRQLPAKGQFAVFVGAWTAQAVVSSARGVERPDFDAQLAHIQNTERAWVEGGALLLKYWLELPAKKLRKRLDEAHERKFARFDDLDWGLATDLDRTAKLAQTALQRTGTECAPWHVVESHNRRHRDAFILTSIADELERRLAQRPAQPVRVVVPRVEDAPTRPHPVPSGTVDQKQYREELRDLQAQLDVCTRKAMLKGLTGVLVFEGWDAAGKGGAIRRVTAGLDPLCYQVTQIAAPTEPEAARHYLWRFWTRLGRPGRLCIFDRSWYGRVLVERVEGFAEPDDWQRAYAELVDFEQQLVETGHLVHKFWLEVDPQTQLERFRDRENDPLKRYKITEDDYRNRSKWPLYAEAADEMLQRTHRPLAPWRVVPAVCKESARLTVLRTLVERYEAALG